jgi:hypothetical protein
MMKPTLNTNAIRYCMQQKEVMYVIINTFYNKQLEKEKIFEIIYHIVLILIKWRVSFCPIRSILDTTFYAEIKSVGDTRSSR